MALEATRLPPLPLRARGRRWRAARRPGLLCDARSDAVLGPVLQAAAGARFRPARRRVSFRDGIAADAHGQGRPTAPAAAARALRDASPQGRRPPSTRRKAWPSPGARSASRRPAATRSATTRSRSWRRQPAGAARVPAARGAPCEGRVFAGDQTITTASRSRDAFHPRHCFGKTLAEYAAFLEGDDARAPPPDAPGLAFVPRPPRPGQAPAEAAAGPFKGDAVLAALDGPGAAAERGAATLVSPRRARYDRPRPEPNAGQALDAAARGRGRERGGCRGFT